MNYYKKLALELFIIIIFIAGLSAVSSNYLFFHVIVELFAVVIMCILFAVTLNAQHVIDNKYLIFVGSSGFFIGTLDLLHTLTFDGMNIIDSTRFYANQFWIATRFFESLILLAGFIYVFKNRKVKVNFLLLTYSIVTCAIILSILHFKNFPVCYIKGYGQTHFKIYGEYVIIGILITSLALLLKKKQYFSEQAFVLIALSIFTTILSEFCFTLYFSNFDYVNKLGHIFKVLSFYMIYKANISSGFQKPMETYFRELKISEEKIKQYSVELEKQIATRNRFFSIISHDLKNPFTIIMGYSELLLKKNNDLDPASREKFIRNIFDSSKQTYNLLENLLAWSRTQTKTMQYRPSEFNIEEAINKNILLISKNAELKEIVVEKNIFSQMVFADIEMVKTVIRNLLTNALKYTPRGGKIVIETKLEEKFLIVSIGDNGTGMEQEKVNSLFQMDKAFSIKGTEQETGTGLGLILCYEFITLNGGKIWVESTPGVGSTFYFTLKMAEKTS